MENNTAIDHVNHDSGFLGLSVNHLVYKISEW